MIIMGVFFSSSFSIIIFLFFNIVIIIILQKRTTSNHFEENVDEFAQSLLFLHIKEFAWKLRQNAN